MKKIKIFTNCLHCSKPFKVDEARYDSFGVRNSICVDCFATMRGEKTKKKWFNLHPLERGKYVRVQGTVSNGLGEGNKAQTGLTAFYKFEPKT